MLHEAATGALREIDRIATNAASVFAFESLGHCWAFAQTEKRTNPWRYYEIDLIGPVATAPMALVDVVMRLGQSERRVPAVVHEYWSPCKHWKFYEHFATSGKIVREVTSVVVEATVEVLGYLPGVAAKMDYQADHDLAKRIWPYTSALQE